MSIKLMTIVWTLPLDVSEKMVLLALADNASDEGQCFPSVKRLTEKTSLSERTVQRMISRLDELGHLTCHMRQGRSTVYTIHPRQGDTPVRVTPPSQRRDTPVTVTPTPVTVTPHPRHGDTHNHQVTIKEPSGEPERGARKARTPPRKRAPEDFRISDQMRAWAAQNVPGIDVDRETEAFMDHEFRNGKTDWPATWRSWMRKAVAMGPGASSDGGWKPPPDEPGFTIDTR